MRRGKRFLDRIGALEKGIKMKRMEPYADIIGEVLEKYNTKKINYIRELVNGYGNKVPDEVREILLSWKPEEYKIENVA